MMIRFNSNKCNQCGQCIKACPFTVLTMEKDCLAMILDKEKYCIDCFHCISICKQKAVSAEGIPAIDVRVDKALAGNGSDIIANYVRSRRSVRKYNDKMINKEIIQAILQNAEWAPSAKNQHPTKWIVVSGKDKTDHIMEMVLKYVNETGQEPLILSEHANGNNIATFDAPYLLFAYADTSAVNPFADSVIAMTMADLMFCEKGIRTCWGGYMIRIANNCQEIREYLNIPENCKVYGVLGLGYTDVEQYSYLPHRKKPIIRWL